MMCKRGDRLGFKSPSHLLRRGARLVTSRADGGHVDTLVGFALVGASGILVNQAILWALVEFGHLNYLLGAVIATQGSTTWNFLLNEVWVFRGRTSRDGVFRRFLAFAGINNLALLARAPLLAFFTSVVGLHYLVANLLTLVLLFAVRFSISDRLVWRSAPDVGESKGDHGVSQTY